MRWIEECVFTSNVYILVNDSPTKEFNMGMGIRQGDPLTHFLFILAAWGLTCLVKKVVSLGNYLPFKVNENIQFEILQFSDDTMLLGEVS